MNASRRPVNASRRPAFTISLVAWNGLRWLPDCVGSLRAQSLEDWELAVLDNASTDGSADWLEAQALKDDRIRFSRSGTNTGYAAAHNRAIFSATGEALLLLNQDVVLDPGFLQASLDRLRGDPSVGSIQGRVLRLGPGGERRSTIDTTGLVMHRDRRVVSRDQLRDESDSRRAAGPVWGVDGPVPVYRREALLGAKLPRRGGGWEVLDEDFVAQKVDSDLAWRLRRLGWESLYEPAAVAWHARSGADSGTSGPAAGLRANMANPAQLRVEAWRNQRLMQLKNDEVGAAIRDAAPIVRRELGMWMWMLAADQRRLRAIPQVLRLAPMAMRKRRALAAAARTRQRPAT